MTIICPNSGRRTMRRMMQKSEKKNSPIPRKLRTEANSGPPCPIVEAIATATAHSPNEYGIRSGAYFLGPRINCLYSKYSIKKHIMNATMAHCFE